MTTRVLASAAIAVAALAAVGAPAAAQTYPPPVNSITVDDITPTQGQAITVSLRTCRPGTTALLGIGLSLVGAPRVGADGVARATVTVPRHLRPGRHLVSGACVAPGNVPLFLSTGIRVAAAGGGNTGGGGGPRPGGSPPLPGPVGAVGAGVTSGTGGATGPSAGASELGRQAVVRLGEPVVPADAPLLFDGLATANGVTDGGGTEPSADDGAGAARASASRSDGSDGSDGSGDDGSTLSTLARVALGVAALGGVPVALAFSRRPPRLAERGFA